MANISKTDHVVLLVGKNPLPNAVAGKLLVKPGGLTTLVCSNDSSDVAGRLSRWLRKEIDGVDVVQKEVQESDPLSIYEGVKSCLKGESIGLNYTGGTKMMSVHAYRAVEHWAKGKRITPVFSYLDARTLEMVFDPSEEDISGKRIYVGQEVKMKVKDLLDLHGREEEIKDNKSVLFSTAKKLAETCSKFAGFSSAWNNWIELMEKTGCFYIPGDEEIDELLSKYKKDDSDLKAKLVAFKGAFEEVYKTLYKELGQEDRKIDLKQPDIIKEFVKWLKGEWLDHYVFFVLKELQHELKLNDIVLDLKTKGTKFEVDVAAIVGYQLFAFSCKTSKKDKLKLGLFEAYVRARQLGGEEARVALVCCAEDPEVIEREIEMDFDLKGRVRVFGRRDLGKLGTLLEDWIRTQSGGGE